MTNISPNPRPLEGIFASPIADPKTGQLSRFGRDFMRDVVTRLDKTITNLGQIAGRTESIQTTVSQLTAAGKLATTDSIAADGSGSPLTGGKRAAVALDANSRLASSFYNNPANVSAVPLSATQLSNDGNSPLITISAGAQQFPFGNVNYGAGSVNPGIYGIFYIYADDPTFSGENVNYQFTQKIGDLTAANGRVAFGSIITTHSSAATGGGNTGGTTGNIGGKGYTPV